MLEPFTLLGVLSEFSRQLLNPAQGIVCGFCLEGLCIRLQHIAMSENKLVYHRDKSQLQVIVLYGFHAAGVLVVQMRITAPSNVTVARCVMRSAFEGAAAFAADYFP